MDLDHLFILINEGRHWLVIVRDKDFLNSCSTLSSHLQMGGPSHGGPLQVGGRLTDRLPFRRREKVRSFALVLPE